jgi:hypothetical protein
MKTALLLVVSYLWGTCFASSSDSVAKDAEAFLPYSEATELTVAEYRQLASSSSHSSSSNFIDSSEYYDGYQQAWRLLGFYIDCSQRERDGNDEHHSHDEDGRNSKSRCVRYLIWAAVSIDIVLPFILEKVIALAVIPIQSSHSRNSTHQRLFLFCSTLIQTIKAVEPESTCTTMVTTSSGTLDRAARMEMGAVHQWIVT